MQQFTATITKIWLDGSLQLDCPPAKIPPPGSFLLAWDNHAGACGTPLYPTGTASPTTPRVAPIGSTPSQWDVGSTLTLRAPIGRGFQIPKSSRRIALAAIESTPARLLPLILPALAQNAEVALFCDITPADLPFAVEISPLETLPQNLHWADFLALDLPTTPVEHWHTLASHALGNVQALVRAQTPCAGLALCGVCALTLHGKTLLLCHEGPVIPLNAR